MTIELNKVHLQRLRSAIAAARMGQRVEFRVNGGEPATLVWTAKSEPRTQHVIMSLYGQQKEWLEAVRSEFLKGVEV